MSACRPGKLFIKIIKLIPRPVIDKILLTFPFLYRWKFVDYESCLPDNGKKELLNKLGDVLHIDGNVIECGSARCGTTVIMADYLRTNARHKLVYACDTFGGFDLNELKKEREACLTYASDKAFTYNSHDYVKSKIEKFGLTDIVITVKGFFKDTLPKMNSKFCFAFIDCDLRDSIIFCTETIWEKLSHEGIIMFDDYESNLYSGAKDAVDYLVDKYKSEISEHDLIKRLYFIRKR